MKMSMKNSYIKNFLEPATVAVVGASRRTGEDNPNVVANLMNCGYKGKIYPININAKEILGFRTYSNVKMVPDEIELAVIATPRDTVLQVVKDCVDKKIRAIVILAQGFGDSDEVGKLLQAKIVDTARKGGARIMGPNTLGSSNAYLNFTTSFRPLLMEKVPIGLICQTGSLVMGFPHFKFIGKCLDLGNAADIDIVDALEYFCTDPQVEVIAMHMEGIKHSKGKRFIMVAKEAVRRKPVIVLKTGKSERGARAVASHTGSMSGTDSIYSGVFKQCGIIRANDIDEFTDLCRAFLSLPLLCDNRIGVITGSGGIGIAVTDICEQSGLRLAKLSNNTISGLQKFFPAWFSVDNPLDIAPAATIMGHPRQQTYRMALRYLLRDENVDAVIFVGHPISPGESWNPSRPAIEVGREFPQKPILFWLYGHYAQKVSTQIEKESTLMVCPSVSRTVKILHSLWCYSQTKSSMNQNC